MITMSGNENKRNILRVTVQFEGRLICGYDGVDGKHYYIVEVLGTIPENQTDSERVFDMMFYQYMLGRVTYAVHPMDMPHVAIMVDSIPADEYHYTNDRFYGGILPIPDDLAQYERE